MKPWTILGHTRTPDGTELTLTQHTSEYAILANGQSLMSSRMHASEEALALLGCRRARTLPRPRILVGGLGMGFTLRQALDCLPPAARVVVAELVPDVVAWNRGPLGALASHPLDDPRVRVEVGDVAATMRSSPGRFDAILLDVDNGPVALTASSNAALYNRHGVAAARAALTPGGGTGGLVGARRSTIRAAAPCRGLQRPAHAGPQPPGQRLQAHRSRRSRQSTVTNRRARSPLSGCDAKCDNARGKS